MEKEENHKSIEANNEYKQDQELADMDLNLDGEHEDEKENQEDDDDGEISKATCWIVPNKRKRGERDDLDLCSICLKPWTSVHQMSCLPCGHIFGMSCIKEWMEGRSSYRCPECFIYFSLKSVRLLSATRLCIPADQKELIRRFPCNKKGFTAFKEYQPEPPTNAFYNRFHALKQRADVLARQKDAMKRRAELLNRMANAQQQAKALQCLADVEKQAEALRCRLMNIYGRLMHLGNRQKLCVNELKHRVNELAYSKY